MLKHVLWGGVAAAFFATTSAHAACTQSNLAGRFMAYASTSDRVTHCSIRIKANGSLVAGTPCRQILNGGQTINATIKSGQLSAANTCRVTGNLVLQSGGQSLTVRIIDAQANRDKNSLSGVGIDTANFTFMFSAQRI
jgi:FlaG/FlaF family flagellin (archaellin)